VKLKKSSPRPFDFAQDKLQPGSRFFVKLLENWIPAFAGMTYENAGVTEKGVFEFDETVFLEQ